MRSHLRAPRFHLLVLALTACGLVAAGGGASAAVDGAADGRPGHRGEAGFTLEEVLSFPYPTDLVAAADADRIAWVENLRGVRNVRTAAGPEFEPTRLTDYAEDDGRPLSGLALTPDGSRLVYVRGGAPNRDGEHPNPTSDPGGAERALWVVPTDGGRSPWRLAEGNGPVISPSGDRVIFSRRGRLFEASLEPPEQAEAPAERGPHGEGGAAAGSGEGAPGDAREEAAEGDVRGGSTSGEKRRSRVRPLFEARGRLGSPSYSPDGSRVLFTSQRGDHAFVGVYDRVAEEITWVAPSVDRDVEPVWSPDGSAVAFLRLPGEMRDAVRDLTGGTPFEVWVGDPETGAGRRLWRSPGDDGGFAQYYPEEPLRWAGDVRLLFWSEHDGWMHVYSLPAAAGGDAEPVDLTPGECEAEHSALSADGETLYFSSNCDDVDRRHLWRVPTAPTGNPTPEAVTGGHGIETDPVLVPAGGDDDRATRLAYRSATATRPQAVALIPLKELGTADGPEPRLLSSPLPDGFPQEELVVPRQVTFEALDGLTIHGQLFLPRGAAAGDGRPAAIFMHGGPIRQMLLGWHYRGYYANAYAMNQYLASRGYVVLSVNYRSGIGHGRAFRRAENQGPRGASEYRDILAADVYLRGRPEVDGDRIGLWGGSYGGYLTALGLARDSDLFAAGVDLHGVHDWAFRATDFSPGGGWGLQGEELLERARRSSPVADLGAWSSPVLFIHGDDDRNVLFQQTTDLVRRLRERPVHVETLVFPDEVHGFLRHASWLRAYRAAASFFDRFLGDGSGAS